MWNPDVAPRMGFEQLARRVGLVKARRIWAIHQKRIALAAHQAAQQEKAWAESRWKRNRGKIIVKNDDDFYPTFKIARYTMKALWRSTLPERGCTGGEALFDEAYMRDFLKKNPECDPGKPVTGDIRSGWTRQLETAAKQGKQERAIVMAQTSLRLQSAAKQAPLITA